jgi:hypothetical protein
MSEFRMMEVELRAEVSRTVSGVSSPLQTNVNEFIRGLRQFGISVTPSKMETIIVAMTAQNSRARRRLEQTGNPGYEVQGGIDAATSISRHVDTRAATIAKIALRPKLDRLMNVKSEESRKLWFGDKEKLKRLKDAYDTALSSNAPEGVVKDAKLEYFGYKHKMDKTIKVVNGREINQGNKYLSDMHSLLAFVNSNRDINESDWGSGPAASWVRRWAARAQLGGMMTQPIMNSIGPYTNFVPWLATYNSKTGFGGGAGIAKAYAAYTRAFTDVGVGGMVPTKLGREMNTAEYWDRVATGAEENEYVSMSEAKFIADETRSGILTPAQANSVIGNARGHSTNPLIEKATDAWMYFYQSSEQSTRRAAGLAAFRIAWDRQLQKAGKTEAELAKSPDEYRKAFSAARDFAVDGVNKTLGDYSAPNRPAAWRSGFQSFLYMYKVWTTTSVQTFARLDMTGKALFLIPLLFCSGLSGVPFAEDLEDLIDTLLQKTGTPIGSIRMEIAKQIDAIFPGLSGPILSGPGSALLGADVAGKFGLGDMAPATGMLLAGADIGATFKEVAGPAFGFLSGLTTGGYLAATAPFSDTTTLVDALREGPITLGRALGDGYAYMSSGAVIDKRGYVITPNASIDMLAARVLGFTPTATASAYGIIAQAKRQTDYQKAKVAIFRQGLLKAELSGDTKTAKSIRQHVKEWNASTKGTALEIKDFEKNYQNLKKRAVLPATKRFLQSTSKSAQDEVSLAIDLFAYD